MIHHLCVFHVNSYPKLEISGKKDSFIHINESVFLIEKVVKVIIVLSDFSN
jgi:hypothetical protein